MLDVIRQKLCEVLIQVSRLDFPADVVLGHFFKKNKQLGKRDRKMIADAVFAALRYGECIKRTHDISTGSLIEYAADCALKFVQTKKPPADWGITPELPQWIIDQLRLNFDEEEIFKIGHSMAENAPFTVRVNTLKARRDKVLRQLLQEGLRAKATPFSPWGIVFDDAPMLKNHPLFLNGTLEVQDEGSQILAYLARPSGESLVVDYCAGAGGKTLALGAAMQNKGRLYACDISLNRLNALKERLLRSGLTCVNVELLTSGRIRRLNQKCARVLVDAPCSGSGTLRRSPDLKYRQSQQTLESLCAQQQEILQAASHLVEVGGLLIYATCSLFHCENNAQVDYFLDQNKAFEILPVSQRLPPDSELISDSDTLQMLPYLHHTDGFFAAILHRKA